METNKIDKARPEKTQAEESSPPLSSEWIFRAKNIPLLNTARIKIDNKAPEKEASPLLCSCARQSLPDKKNENKIINPR